MCSNCDSEEVDYVVGIIYTFLLFEVQETDFKRYYKKRRIRL